MNNQQIAAALKEFADRLEASAQNPYRVRAFNRAAETIHYLPRSVKYLATQGELHTISSVGEAIAEDILSLLSTGTFPQLSQARIDVDDKVLKLMTLPGIGVKTALKIAKTNSEESFDSLTKKAFCGEITASPTLTTRTIKPLKQHYERAHISTKPELKEQCFRRDTAENQFHVIKLIITKAVGKDLKSVKLAGEMARGCELIRHLDVGVIVDHQDLATISSAIRKALTSNDFFVDKENQRETTLNTTTPSALPATITILTSSDRSIASLVGPKKWKRWESSPLAERVAFELRDSVCEGVLSIEQAAHAELVTSEHIRGELHAHSTWSDGRASIYEMACAARDQGDSYFLVSDHSAPYAMVGGLTFDRLKAQKQEIVEARERLASDHAERGVRSIQLLHGIEVEILKDGSLGLPDNALEDLDWVVAAMHTALTQSEQQIKKRIQRVIDHPLVDALAHPTSRRLLQRERTQLDVGWLIEAAAERALVLEINANPERLDLDSNHARRALNQGAKLVINCDAHHPTHLAFRAHGVAVARRAGARSDQIVNCLEIDQIHAQRRRNR